MWALLFCTISILSSQLEAKPGCVKPTEPAQPDIHCTFKTSHDTNVVKDILMDYNVTQNPINVTCSDEMTQQQVDDKLTLLMTFFKGQSPRKNVYDTPVLKPVMWFQIRCAREGVAEVKLQDKWIEVTNGHCSHSEPYTAQRGIAKEQEAEWLQWTVKLVS